MSNSRETYPRVLVLLSTYNGEQYLSAQLDSLLAQREVNITLLVRDDGSNDGTRTILKQYAACHPDIVVVEGSNVGVVASYLHVMHLAGSSDADYYALCDQDDVWLPQKLAEAVRWLASGERSPQMYCSAVRYVDAELRELGVSRTQQQPAFANALVENIAVGCTSVFNRAALDLVNSAPPKHALMHDWWLYLVVSAFGQVLFDARPWILYRQHGRNVIGGTTSLRRMIATRLRRLRLRRDGVFRCSDQAREFLSCFGERCPAPHVAVVKDMLAARGRLISRVRFAFSKKVHRNHWLDDSLLRILLIAGLY